LFVAVDKKIDYVMLMRVILLTFVFTFCLHITRTYGQDSTFNFIAQEWTEADQLFHQDYRWKGADGAYSIDLGKDRVLWLFADTYIAFKAPYVRNRACVSMIRNSIGIQKGIDPTKATMRFFWRTDDSLPLSFFQEKDSLWYWPLDGIRIDQKLLIFFAELHSKDRGSGFELCNHTAVAIDNPDDNPLRWRIQSIPLPPYREFHIMIGSAVEVYEDYLYSFCCQEPGTHDNFLVRWPIDSARIGYLLNPEWWTGDKAGWLRQPDSTNSPEILFKDGATEFSVWFDSSLKTFFQVQTIGYGQAHLAFRQATKLTGPWSEAKTIFNPAENNIPGIMIYAGKAHPHINDTAIVLTYATNGPESLIVADTCIYYPRFVRVNLIPQRLNR
jgi:hypothetical protein